MAENFKKNILNTDAHQTAGVVCAICMSGFDAGDRYIRCRECTQPQHSRCVRLWFESPLGQKSQCPLCRTAGAFINAPEFIANSINAQRQLNRVYIAAPVRQGQNNRAAGERPRVAQINRDFEGFIARREQEAEAAAAEADLDVPAQQRGDRQEDMPPVENNIVPLQRHVMSPRGRALELEEKGVQRAGNLLVNRTSKRNTNRARPKAGGRSRRRRHRHR